MKRLLIAFLIQISVALNVFGQTIDYNPVIQNLIQDNKPVAFVSYQKTPYFLITEAFNTYPQNLIKRGKDVYVFINGSGRLYKIITTNTGFQFVRVDSTTHFGYNINSFGFCYNNHIYNLGGYGFWRLNGQLRIFNEKAQQWDIVKLNKEIPVLTSKTEGLLWYDVAGKKIYAGYYLQRNEAIKSNELEETQFIYDVMVLDLKTNEWVQLGDLNNELWDKLSQINILTMSPWGLMVTIGDKITLLDFKHNQILALDIHKDYYQSIMRANYNSSYYFKDSTLYYGNNANKNFESVLMHYTDFVPSNDTLYRDSKLLWTKNMGYFIFIIALLLGLAYVLQIKKSKLGIAALKINHDDAPVSNWVEDLPQIFEEKEIQLLQLIIHNSSLGKTTSIDEQNKILGLTKKNAEIQKKQRSDIIITINRKYAFITQKEAPLIQKKRTEFDKRTYEYFIDYAILEVIGDFLQKWKFDNGLHINRTK